MNYKQLENTFIFILKFACINQKYIYLCTHITTTNNIYNYEAQRTNKSKYSIYSGNYFRTLFLSVYY